MRIINLFRPEKHFFALFFSYQHHFMSVKIFHWRLMSEKQRTHNEKGGDRVEKSVTGLQPFRPKKIGSRIDLQKSK